MTLRPSTFDLVDSHCHLQFDAYAGREDEVLAAASAVGVKKIICVGTSLADSQTAVDLARHKKDVWAAVGVHPHEADAYLDNSESGKILNKLSILPRVVAIGEIGLDFYRNLSAEAKQEQALRDQIQIGLKTGLPFIFHVRDAWTDFWRIVDEYKGVHGVVHSFSSGTKQLDQVLSRGFYVGLNGIMTFTRDEAQLEAARRVPSDKLILETDAPFLTPAPNRNELCEPRHVRTTAQFLADLRGEALEELAKATTTNAIKLFGLK